MGISRGTLAIHILMHREVSVVISRLRSAGHELLDMLLPPRCVSCRDITVSQAGLCATCWSGLTLIDAPRCAVTGVPFPYGDGDDLISPAALKSPPLYHRARGAVIYDKKSRLLVHGLKYQDRHEAALPMARLMAVAGRDVIAASDLLMPVPLHRWRLWRRRYNQAALLAMRIARFAAKPCHYQGPFAFGQPRRRSGSMPNGEHGMSGARSPCRQMPMSRSEDDACCLSMMC